MERLPKIGIPIIIGVIILVVIIAKSAVTIESGEAGVPVSYTHLTLPTIYSV